HLAADRDRADGDRVRDPQREQHRHGLLRPGARARDDRRGRRRDDSARLAAAPELPVGRRMSAQVATQAPVAVVPPASAPSAAAAVPTGTRHAARRRARQRWLRRVVLGVSLTLLALPIVALLEFSVRYPLTGAVDLDAWRKIVSGR